MKTVLTRVREAVSNTCRESDAIVADFLLDTATDWMSQKRVNQVKRSQSVRKGQSTAELCPHVGDLAKFYREQRHLQWLTEKTEMNEVDYYSEGF